MNINMEVALGTDWVERGGTGTQMASRERN